MNGYYTPAQLAKMLGGGESTYRQYAARGEYLNATKQGNTWFIPLSDVSKHGRGYDQEFAAPAKLSPEYPQDPSDIVLAQNSDGRYGIYLEDDWYGAGQALEMFKYIREHEAWLKVGEVLNDQVTQGQATIDGDMVQFLDEEEPIPLKDLAYSQEIGLYDKRRFPNLKGE